MKYIKLFEEYIPENYNECPNVVKFCKEYDIENYTINDDCSIDVNDNVMLASNYLSKLPIKFRNVYGSFNISFNSLESFDNFPDYIEGDFVFNDNHIEVLRNMPRVNGMTCGHSNRYTNVTPDMLTLLSNDYYPIEDSFDYSPFSHLVELFNDCGFWDGFNNGDPINGFETSNRLSLIEMINKIDEFEVLKNDNQIDMISVNSLFDYYHIPFDEDNFEGRFSRSAILRDYYKII